MHGSYGLEGDHVVLTDALELENLDFNEFEASFDSITLALASHLGALAAVPGKVMTPWESSIASRPCCGRTSTT